MKILIIGCGNVGRHLFNAFSGKEDIDCELKDSRSIHIIDKNFDIIIIAVSDNAIEQVASNVSNSIPDFNGVVTHTSGSVLMSVLSPHFKNYGVFYPVQTFSEHDEIDYQSIPFLIEGANEQSVNMLHELGSKIASNIIVANSLERRKLHLASVFVCNFCNALFQMALEIIKDSEFNFDILLPLITQTVSKIKLLTPHEAQTGPALRGDTKVINKHLTMLNDRPDLKEIYQLISNYISNAHEQN